MNSVDRFLDSCFQIIKTEWNSEERFNKLKELHVKVDSKNTDEQIWSSMREKLILDVTNSLLQRDIALLTYSDYVEISRINVDLLKNYIILRITGSLPK